jgi:ParB family chromosome partitioning protein
MNSELPIDKIHPSPFNPRETITPVDVETIKKTGVVERITVRPHPTKKGEYEIVVGARRWLGAKKAGLKKIPAKVEELTDTEVRVRQLIENLQREELNDIEQGRAFRQLNKEEPFWTHKEIAEKIGKSEQYVRDRINLVTGLAPEIQLEVIKSSTPGVEEETAYSVGVAKARALSALPEKEQLVLAKRIKERGMYRDELLQTIRKGQEIERIISTVERPELRKELAEKYLTPEVKYEPAVKPSEIEMEIKRAMGKPVETPEDVWKRMMMPLNRVYNMFPRNSFVREWRLGDRQYGTLVMWLDVGKEIPELEREDHPKEEFRDFMEADRYAAEHGGYCSGLITLMGREYWCIYVKKKKEAR